MVRVVVYVREVGRLEPEFSLEFELPEVPKVGSYISVYRPDTASHSEDMIVEKVWWHLQHPETQGMEDAKSRKIGSVKEIFVECIQATGPWSTDRWRDAIDQQRKRGVEVPEFEVARLSVRQDFATSKKDDGLPPGHRLAAEEDLGP
jgi:hypothetical protein